MTRADMKHSRKMQYAREELNRYVREGRMDILLRVWYGWDQAHMT